MDNDRRTAHHPASIEPAIGIVSKLCPVTLALCLDLHRHIIHIDINSCVLNVQGWAQRFIVPTTVGQGPPPCPHLFFRGFIYCTLSGGAGGLTVGGEGFDASGAEREGHITHLLRLV
jgi:hypothetical protein